MARRTAGRSHESSGGCERRAPEKRLELALVENIQRENLNPIEEGRAYQRLADDLGLTQEAISTAVGKDRATVANYIRLLNLPREVQAEVAAGALTMGHARTLAGLSDEALQRRVARDIRLRDLSVRETEALVRTIVTPSPPKVPPPPDVHTRAAEEQLRKSLGTRVRIVRRRRGGSDRHPIRLGRRTPAPVRAADVAVIPWPDILPAFGPEWYKWPVWPASETRTGGLLNRQTHLGPRDRQRRRRLCRTVELN